MNSKIVIPIVTFGLISILGVAGAQWWLVAIISALVLLGLLMFMEKQPVASDIIETNNSCNSSGAAQAMSLSASEIAIGGASVSHFLDKLAATFESQSTKIKDIAERVVTVEKGNEELVMHADNAQSKVHESDSQAQQCKIYLDQLLVNQNALSKEIARATSSLTVLKQRADSIAHITTTINQLADQTNMLALNAAIEAARAGEQGRGFAVVADEVRALAKKTTDATQGIDNVLTEIHQASTESVSAISSVSNEGSQMQRILTDTSELISSTSDASSDAASAMDKVKIIISEHSANTSGISSHALELHQSNHSLLGDLEEVSEKVLGLSQKTEDIFRQLHHFNVNDTNAKVRDIAIEAANQIGEIFEHAISSGELSESAVFDSNYKQVANTNPPKYHSLFDGFTDNKFPAVQESILDNNTFIIYAGAVDKNGYFPTHNKKFSQPVTGDHEKDLINSRTKRIFDDPTGIRCARNTETFLLQTYKRDTGETMHDLSAPIFVNGKHWGGFRVGYRPNV